MYDTVVDQFVEKLREHPFIQRCRNGDITDRELKVFLAQHGKYSAYFTRYLCALISNLHNVKDVVQLSENLAEELGYGEQKGEPHSEIFAKMVRGFGIDLHAAPVYPQTQNLIDTTLRYCKQQNPAYGLGALCLGAESIVPALYSDLIDGFLKCGIRRDQIRFFELHVECDDEHAETMRAILTRMREENPRQEECVMEAAHAVLGARLDFFTGVLTGAQQA